MLLSIQILFAIAVSAFALECPPKDKIQPCSCEAAENVVLVKCEELDSLDELKPVIQNTIGYDVSFEFTLCHLGDIPSDLFKGHTSSEIIFRECTINSFGDTPLSGLEDSLKSLYIDDSIHKGVTKMDSFNLSHLKKLSYLSMVYNDIGELENHWFEGGPESLTQLDLDYNEIETVGDRALVSLVNLQQLYAGGNKIKGVVRSVLPNPSKDLWLVELRTNGIEELPTDIFEGYPSLKVINLAGNNLKSIPENVWGKIWSQLQSVHLSGNDIVCDGNLKWIYEQKLPEEFDGKCGPGNDLHNRDLNSLKLEDFQ